MDLRGEFYRLRVEHEAQRRDTYAEQCHAEEAEERRRMMELARQIEEDRAKRVAEQQERLLQKERELEEWKLERAKEVEAIQRRRVEDEDRRRELQYQRELQRLREESELRARSAEKSVETTKQVEQCVREAQQAMLERLAADVKARDEAHRAELAAREEEWVQRLERCEMQRSTELADLQHQLSLDQDRARRGEEQLADARAQLAKIVAEIEGLRVQAQTNSSRERESSASLAEVHRAAIEKLQRMYEEDKREVLRRAAEERDRLTYAHERRLEDLKDTNSALVRNKDVEIDALEARLKQVQGELQDAKAAAALYAQQKEASFTSTMELRRLGDEVKRLEKEKAEVAEARGRLERRVRELEERADAQAKSLQTVHGEYSGKEQQLQQELDEARREGQLAKETLAQERERSEAEVERLKRELHAAAELATSQQAREKEEAARRLKEKVDVERQRWDEEKAQLARKLRAAEDELSAARRAQEGGERDRDDARARLQAMEQEVGAKAAQLQQLQAQLDQKSSLEYELRDANLRCQRLQEERAQDREQRDRLHAAALDAKEREVQQLRGDLAEARKQIGALRDEISTTKYSQDDTAQRLQRQLAEKETEVAQARRETEDARRAVEEWKAALAEQQQRADRNAENLQRVAREREEELRATTERLRRLQDDNSRLESDLRAQETKILSGNSRDVETQRALHERDEAIARLQSE
ncbi:vesicular transport-associated repeat protein, partial [Strigomonas culicis]